MYIGELAAACGLSREALRFYETQGLIRSHRMSNGYRKYAPETIMLIAYIRTAQKLGFSLSEIGNKIPELWDNTSPSAEITRVLQEKLHDIDERISALKTLRQDLAARLETTCPLRAM